MTREQADAYLSENYPAATLDGDPEWVREMTETLMTDPSSVTDPGYEPPESLDYFVEPDPKIPPLSELEGAAVILNGEVVGRVGKVEPAASLDSSVFEIRDNREDRSIVATLNSLGHTVKLGDTVSHVATKDDRGTVEEIGSALIANTDVPNAVKVRWPSPAGIEDNDTVSWHHVDNLIVQHD
jgi:hypothetical protein